MAIAWEKITVTTTAATGITPERQGRSALISVETNPVRIRYDGGAATATDGHLLNAGDTIRITSADDLAKTSVIAIGANAVLQITYGAL